jgi:hypothetical protein
MTVFEENEKLKEMLVMECGAFEAKSNMFSDGVPIIPDPFLETIARWDKDAESSLIAKGINAILDFRDRMDKRCFVTDVQYETSYGHPQLLWAIFKEEESIFPT